MSKSKSAMASKPVGSRKPAAKLQRARQAVVRSAKPEKPPTAIPVPEKPMMVSDNASQRAMRQNDLTKAFNVFSATANVGAYQRKLPEIAQAYMQLAFQFAQRLAQIKSPFEMPGVFAELATQQLAIFQNIVVPNHGIGTPRP
jgi:hypothetical protein